MTVGLTKHYETLIERALETGRWRDASEVVRAALSQFEQEELPLDYPPGSLKHLYTRARKAEELQLNKVCSLRVDHDE